MKKRRAAVERIEPKDLLQAIQTTGSATEAARLLRVADRSVRRALVRLETAGRVRREGNGKNTRWEGV